MGRYGDRQCVPLIVAFVNLLANGQAPRKLSPYLGGATGTALDKVSKSGEQDARPVCSGEYWRRLVGKALLGTEVANLRDYLAPHQLAVGVAAGVEVMPHLARQWLRHFADDADRLLLAYDEGNAHNEVDRGTFLTRMSQVAPGLCRWLEFIYPTDMSTIVVYKGRKIESKAGGQQGCPLMMACHAVVQRILLEALGIVEADPRTTAVAPVIEPAAVLDMTPMFADDGFFAGKQAEVRRALVHLRPIMPSLGLRFSMLEVVPAAGPAHSIDLQAFREPGCSVNETANVEILKSPIGVSTWCAQYSRKIADKAAKAAAAAGDMPDAHVGYYLLRNSASACRLNYLARTTPPEDCVDALGHFDGQMRCAFSSLTGFALTTPQWAQASAPVRHAGLGLRSAAQVADVAYLASVTSTAPPAEAIWPEYALCRNGAAERASRRLLDNLQWAPSSNETSPDLRSQRTWARRLEDRFAQIRRDRGEPDSKVRAQAFSTRTSCRWHGAIPSKTLDTSLSNCQFRDNVALQLGVEVLDEMRPCRFCGAVCDLFGRHCLSCTAGGDSTLVHNEVRDEVFSWCGRARLRPELEKSGLLHQIGVPGNKRRPADVLVCRAAGFLQGLPGGTAPEGCTKVALDFAVINALGEQHHQRTADRPLSAAVAYSEQKAQYQNTASRCAQVGVAFEPVVIEAQGGIEPRAAALLHRIADAVAKAEGTDAADAKRQLLQRIALILARANSRSIAKRSCRPIEPEHRGVKRAIDELAVSRAAATEFWF